MIKLDPGHEKYTWIHTSGKVAREGNGGIVIVSEMNHPIAVVGEVADEDITSIFFDVPAPLSELDEDARRDPSVLVYVLNLKVLPS